ncbi:MAG: Multifunctional conjugation protein TraI [Firmicutes bacterium]|nr:Multifunctional conjugation protein TraI [Bacillota bacterium]
MISITKLKAVKTKGAGGVVAYMATTEYYADKGIGSAKWEGEGAKRLGLHGKSQEQQNKDFEALLKGQDPNNGKKLGKGKNGNLMGLDLTFNAPKAFTLAYALGDDETKAKVLEAHTKARQSALAFLLDQPMLRRGNGGATRVEKADAPILRVITHIDNRNGEAHLHDHCVLLAKAQAADGSWLTIDNAALIQANHAASSLYDRALAEQMERMGFTIEKQRHYAKDQEKPHVSYHIAGLSDELEEATSSRSIEATNLARELGITKAEAIKRTRQDKKDLSPEEVLANTKAIAEGLGVNGLEATREAKPERGEFKPKSQGEIFKHLHRTESTFTHFALIDALTKEGYDKPIETAQSWLKEHCLEFEQSVAGSALYCSKAQYELEQSITTRAKARESERFHHIDKAVVDKAVEEHQAKQGFTLTDEQREAVDFLTMKTGGYACIEGFAGAGKSASAGAYCRAFEAAGFKVIGTSTSQVATDNLGREAGIEAYNCAKLLSQLDSGKMKLTPHSVLLMDEAGMADAKTVAGIQDYVDQAGAKMVLVGDTFQLQPVGAGQAFRMMTEETGKFQQTEIKRQKWEEGIETAKAFYSGKSGEAIVQDWTKNGTLTEHDEKQQAIEALVKDYFESDKAPSQKLVLVNTNADALMVAKQLRNGLKATGELDASQERSIHVQDPEKERGKTMAMPMAVGERLRFTDGYRDKETGLAVANNSKATLLGFAEGKDGLALRMKLETTAEATNGKEVEIPLAKFKSFAYGWTSTNHSAQGLGADDVFWLDGGGKVDRNMGLVAFTRSKQSFKAYTTDAESLGEHMEEWGKKPAASELTLKRTPDYDPEIQRLGAEVVASALAKATALPKQQALTVEMVEGRRAALMLHRAEAQKTKTEMEGFIEQRKKESPEYQASVQSWAALKEIKKQREEHAKSGVLDKGLSWVKGDGAKALEKREAEAEAKHNEARKAYQAWKAKTFEEAPKPGATPTPEQQAVAKLRDAERLIAQTEDVEHWGKDQILGSMSSVKINRMKEQRLGPTEATVKPSLAQRMKGNKERLAALEAMERGVSQDLAKPHPVQPFNGRFPTPNDAEEYARAKRTGVGPQPPQPRYQPRGMGR